MRFGYREDCLDHDTGSRHPETADRLRAIRRGLRKRHGVAYEEGRLATVDELEAVHDRDYVEAVRTFCEDGGGTWDADTVAVEATWEAARAAAGLASWAAEAALEGADGRDTPFSIGRPPGHHAESDEAMGFCFFNNAAVAATAALDRDDVDRVAVFDWDVHHGNGTQELCYDHDDRYYASVHERGLFPGTGEVRETGGADARRTNLNVPLPGGAGDAEYAAVVDDLLAPSLARFDPDLLLVSAGFDAHRHDPISRMRVSTGGYGHLTATVRALADRCDAALAFVLEGGYGLDALADSVGMVHAVFDGREPVAPEADVNDDARSVVRDVADAHGL
jgi:acetoin utilization deacetylase AcuC-like enzyme